MSSEVEESPIRALKSEDDRFAVLAIQGDLRDLIVAGLRRNYLQTGRFTKDARLVSHQALATLAYTGVAGAVGGANAATAPTVYLASAAPESLMRIGSGLGSAVMGSNGIVKQAPFIPINSAVFGTIPLLALQVTSTAMTMHEFETLNAKIDDLKREVDSVLARIEASAIADLLTSVAAIDEISDQYALSGSFSTDMIVRLAIAEREIRSLSARYEQLATNGPSIKDSSGSDLSRANLDAHCAILASISVLRVQQLRVSLAWQEDPLFAEVAVHRLEDSTRSAIALWETLLHRSDELREEIERVRGDADAAPIRVKVADALKKSAQHRIQELQSSYTMLLESEKRIIEAFYPLIAAAKATLAQIEDGAPKSSPGAMVVAWEDESGAHSIVTGDLGVDLR